MRWAERSLLAGSTETPSQERRNGCIGEIGSSRIERSRCSAASSGCPARTRIQPLSNQAQLRPGLMSMARSQRLNGTSMSWPKLASASAVKASTWASSPPAASARCANSAATLR